MNENSTKQRPKIRLNTLWMKLLVPMMVLNIMLALLFYGTIFLSGTITELRINSMGILSGKVSGRADSLQQQMNSIWGNFDENLIEIEATVTQVLNSYDKATFKRDTYEVDSSYMSSGSNSITDIGQNYEADGKDYLTEYLLKCLSEDVEKLLRQNHVTGAYIILDGDPDREAKEGLYFRRASATATIYSKSDLVLLVAPPRATVDYCSDFGSKSISMNKFFFDTSSGAKLGEIYGMTFSNAYDAAEAAGGVVVNTTFAKNYSYWAPAYKFTNINSEIISYNAPLVYNGVVYGVLGVDINVGNITSLLNPTEIMGGTADGSYMLSVRENGDNNLKAFLVSGILLTKLYGNNRNISIVENVDGLCHRLQDGTAYNSQVYASIKPLVLYNNNTPYSDTVWELSAVVEESVLFDFSSTLMQILLQSLLISVAVSVTAVTGFSLYMSLPVKRLAAEVRSNKSLYKRRSIKTNIYEIDELVGEIQSLAANVLESSSKLEQIIQVANVPIGAFEEREGANNVFYTGRFFALLGIPYDTGGCSGELSSERFYKLLSEADGHIYFTSADGSETMYQIFGRWVRLNITRSAGRILGVISDITNEINEKKKLTHERDHDLMTQLLNRRAFYERCEELFDKPQELKVAAVIMSDLDDLKSINDNYGHGLGDDYIIAMAQILRKNAPENSFVSRLSGDEFAVVVYGEKDKRPIRKFLDALMEDLKNSKIEVGEGLIRRVSASIGVAWYPEHSKSFHELMRQSDIAMYKAKQSQKACIVEFDANTNEK